MPSAPLHTRRRGADAFMRRRHERLGPPGRLLERRKKQAAALTGSSGRCRWSTPRRAHRCLCGRGAAGPPRGRPPHLSRNDHWRPTDRLIPGRVHQGTRPAWIPSAATMSAADRTDSCSGGAISHAGSPTCLDGRHPRGQTTQPALQVRVGCEPAHVGGAWRLRSTFRRALQPGGPLMRLGGQACTCSGGAGAAGRVGGCGRGSQS